MALDGLLLHQISAELKKELPCRINKIQNVSDVELLFTLRSTHTKRLLISLHSTYNRIHFTDASYTTLEIPTNFVMLLRKQLEGGFIRKSNRSDLTAFCAWKSRHETSSEIFTGIRFMWN